MAWGFGVTKFIELVQVGLPYGSSSQGMGTNTKMSLIWVKLDFCPRKFKSGGGGGSSVSGDVLVEVSLKSKLGAWI